MPNIVDQLYLTCPEADGQPNGPSTPEKMEPQTDEAPKSPTSPTGGIPTRNITVTAPKPAANPLQFIKVGPAGLYRSAHEQLKKVEEVKKVAPVKDEGADWQNNLDNWKSSRRKRQEHIIERVVEVKKFELEDHDRNRRRSKTFNEMMEERSSRGRKLSLPIYQEDNSDDLSDLGLSTVSSPKEKNGKDEEERKLSPLRESVDSLSSKDVDKKDKPIAGGDSNAYEKAVQNCISYAENIVKSRSSQCSGKSESKPEYQKLKSEFDSVLRGSTPKIEGKISELRHRRFSQSDSNADDDKKPLNLPKVDISKRRELFEKISNDTNKRDSKLMNGDLAASKSIRERLSSLEKSNEEKSTSRTRVESEVSVKERLSAMEKITSSVESSPQKTTPPKVALVEAPSNPPVEIYREYKDDDLEEMEQLDILKDKIKDIEEEHKKYISSQMAASEYQDGLFLQELRQSHFRHASLDSLDVDKFRLSNEALKRVQSLEDFDYCPNKNYPASYVSGDTDKEDSGILTADVSSSVSQADDYNLHLDQDQSINHHPIIIEEIAKGRDNSDQYCMSENPAPAKLDNTNQYVTSFQQCEESAERYDAGHNQSSRELLTNASNALSQLVISSANEVPMCEASEGCDPVINILPDMMPDSVFPLENSSMLEPPKEKPPPPPVETKNEKQAPIKSILRRLDSTKRIKKELHQKRSSFLGIDIDDDAYLKSDVDLVKPPPDMAAFLQEERRLDQKMHLQSISRESDSTQGESRDSGVELDRYHPDDIGWHQRHDSEENLTDPEFSEREPPMQTENSWSHNRRSLQDVSHPPLNCAPAKGSLDNLSHVETESRSLQDVSQVPLTYADYKPDNLSRFDCCRSMPNLQDEMISMQRCRAPLQPPVKKQSYSSRDIPDRSSASQQMSKQTIQALSAAPKPRLIASETWMQAKRKPKQESFNYQHWLIQEAEHRRLTDQSMRLSYPSTKSNSNYPQTSTTAPPPQNINDQWIQPHWQDKNANQQWQTNYSCQQWSDSQQWPQQQWNGRNVPERPVANGNHWTGPGFGANNDWNNYNNGQRSDNKNQQWNGGHQTDQWKNGRNSGHDKEKPLPVSIIQTLTQRVQNKMSLSNKMSDPGRRSSQPRPEAPPTETRDRSAHSGNSDNHQEKILSVSGKKKCSHCGDELGRGAAMVIESLRLFYHIDCFKCCVCQVQLGDGLMGTDVRVRNNKLHCHNCYSSEDGVKFSCV
nr:PREDICTED: LIM domain only protein 7 [Bemisia tabaci]